MFIHIKHGGESPPGHPVGCCSPGTGAKRHGLAGLSLCGCCQGCQLPSAMAAHPADDQHFLANMDCAVLRLLSYVRRMAGVPDTGESWLRGCSSIGFGRSTRVLSCLHWGATQAPCDVGTVVRWGAPGSPCQQPTHLPPFFPDVIDLCDELGTPKLLFQVTSLSERASDFLQPHGTYYLCRVEFKVPGRCPAKQSPVVPRGPSSARGSGHRRQE